MIRRVVRNVVVCPCLLVCVGVWLYICVWLLMCLFVWLLSCAAPVSLCVLAVCIACVCDYVCACVGACICVCVCVPCCGVVFLFVRLRVCVYVHDLCVKLLISQMLCVHFPNHLE